MCQSTGWGKHLSGTKWQAIEILKQKAKAREHLGRNIHLIPDIPEDLQEWQCKLEQMGCKALLLCAVLTYDMLQVYPVSLCWPRPYMRHIMYLDACNLPPPGCYVAHMFRSVRSYLTSKALTEMVWFYLAPLAQLEPRSSLR